MDFTNDFDVEAPLDRVWTAMLDVEQVAPCVPGAQILEQTGDDAYKVGIKVKVGPVTMNYRGNVEIVERDESSHRAVMTAKAREARGQGTATARVTMDLSGSDGQTHGTIATNLKLSGKAAAMGSGVVQEVSSKITEQFAGNLATMLTQKPEGDADAGATPADAVAGTVGDAAADAPAGDATAQAAAEQPAGEPSTTGAASGAGAGATFGDDDDSSLDMLSIIRSVAAERLKDPHVLLGALVAAAAIGFLVGRRSRS
jgi:uncharacterized protein